MVKGGGEIKKKKKVEGREGRENQSSQVWIKMNKGKPILHHFPSCWATRAITFAQRRCLYLQSLYPLLSSEPLANTQVFLPKTPSFLCTFSTFSLVKRSSLLIRLLGVSLIALLTCPSHLSSPTEEAWSSDPVSWIVTVRPAKRARERPTIRD